MGKRKKILFFIDWYLPGFKAGGPLRSMSNMALHLADKHDFFIITRNSDYMDDFTYKDIEANKWLRLDSGEYVMYKLEKEITLSFYKNLIREGSYDILYIHGIFSWKFSILPLLAAKLSGARNIIIAPRGMLADSAVSIKSLRKNIFLFIARLTNLYKGVIFHATNKKDKDDIQKRISKNQQIVIADNLPATSSSSLNKVEKSKGELKLFVLARIAHEKNIHYALEILYKFGEKDIKVSFDIYGQIYDKTYWEQCKQIISMLPPNVNVTYKGNVNPIYLNNIISQYHCLFMPTLGENYGHSIYETLSSSRPVLISDRTQWRNLASLNAGWDIDLKDEKAFADTITKLANMGQSEFDSLCEAAKKASVKLVNLEELLNQYNELFSI